MNGTIDITAARVVATQTLPLYSKTIGELVTLLFYAFSNGDMAIDQWQYQALAANFKIQDTLLFL